MKLHTSIFMLINSGIYIGWKIDNTPQNEGKNSMQCKLRVGGANTSARPAKINLVNLGAIYPEPPGPVCQDV